MNARPPVQVSWLFRELRKVPAGAPEGARGAARARPPPATLSLRLSAVVDAEGSRLRQTSPQAMWRRQVFVNLHGGRALSGDSQ